MGFSVRTSYSCNTHTKHRQSTLAVPKAVSFSIIIIGDESCNQYIDSCGGSCRQRNCGRGIRDRHGSGWGAGRVFWRGLRLRGFVPGFPTHVVRSVLTFSDGNAYLEAQAEERLLNEIVRLHVFV